MSDPISLFDGTFSAGGGGSGLQSSAVSDVSPENDLLERLASGSDSIDLPVDYSDFSKFVTFNSAESYVTITADAILNDYPFGGTADDLQAFKDSLDGYQRYFLGLWPSRSGHLRFDPSVSSSYVAVNDFGVDSGVARSSFISPGTGSLSIQCWVDAPIITGSNSTMVLFQKLSSNGDGIWVYLTGSEVRFSVSSGSTNAEVSASLTMSPSFFSAVLDRGSSTGTLSLYVGSTGSYPILESSTTVVLGARFDLGSGSFYVGSGSLTRKVVVPFTGSIDDLSVWSVARDAMALTASFNRKVYAQPGLIMCWRLDDAADSTPASFASILRDSSGHRLDGRVQSYFPALRGSGSLIGTPPDPILTVDDSDVWHYIVSAQQTGSSFDDTNPSNIFELFPDSFVEGASGEVFQAFALTIARHFDRIKLGIDQLVNLYRVNHGDFDQAPDALLQDVGAFFGWEMTGGFIDSDSLRYFLGRGIIQGPAGNIPLDQRLYEIKSAFWRRLLLNLPYLYKTKGTAEAVRALLRVHGADNGFIRLKEYAKRNEATFAVERVTSQKSVYALKFVSGSSVSFVAR